MKPTKLPASRRLDRHGENRHADTAVAARQFSFALLWRGILKHCPQCGVGPLLTGYLKPQPCCSHCGEDFSHISADDGPAWLTLLVVGHAVVPLMIMLGRDATISPWLAIAILTLVTLVGVYFVSSLIFHKLPTSSNFRLLQTSIYQLNLTFCKFY